MAGPTANDIASQMLAQLRVLDPTLSAEIGTPERLLIDAVAQQIADSEVDLTALSGGLNLDTKIGSNLDNFLAIFGFGRQSAVAATGFVTFGRTTAAISDIRIPAGQQVVAPQDTGDVFFRTTFDVTLPAGQTSVIAAIQAITPGASGNVGANTITEFVNGVGFTSVTNDTATSGGLDAETDDQLKTRFRNTVFRNVSGTTDQYLALAVATPFTTKANVVGPISRYREYIQVPTQDDSTPNAGNGNPNEWTTALSTIPFSKHIYDNVPYFVSNGQLGAAAVFYRQDSDFRLNVDPDDKNRGDAYRIAQDNSGDETLDPTSTVTQYQPNVTFLDVLDPSTDPSVQGVRPGDVVLFEHSYMSSASRNDFDRNLLNAVDVFIDGGNSTSASCVIARPSTLNLFNTNQSSPYYVENYRRVGESEHRPMLGNLFTPLFFQPVTDIPSVIQIGDTNYYRDSHYWLVEDVSPIGGTVRARNGIEWDKYLPGQLSTDDPDDPTTWSGPVASTNTTTSLSVSSYSFDKNIMDLQASMEAAKQTTTDVLAHKATLRYFKLDITVMYTAGSNIAESNSAIHDAVAAYFASQYFGTTIQLSDLLQVIHNVPQVDNVRWSRDVRRGAEEFDSTVNRVVAVNADGTLLMNLAIDRVTLGNADRTEQLSLYITGSPTSGAVTVQRDDTGATATWDYDAIAANVQTALRTLTGDSGLLVTGAGTAVSPWLVTYSATGARPVLEVSAQTLDGGPSVHNFDFYLEDNELPALPDDEATGDTIPGLIIRPRAQNTWTS